MILSPANVDLTWKQVEASLREDGEIAAEIWRDCGITVPPDGRDALICDRMDALLASTACALNIIPQDIFKARQRIKWRQFYEGSGEAGIYASLDGGEALSLTFPK